VLQGKLNYDDFKIMNPEYYHNKLPKLFNQIVNEFLFHSGKIALDAVQLSQNIY
jgi:hypothetical protein